MKKKCEYYDEYTLCEPPLEPDEDGKAIKEYECKKAKHYFVVTCDGNLEECDLEIEKIIKGDDEEKGSA